MANGVTPFEQHLAGTSRQTVLSTPPATSQSTYAQRTGTQGQSVGDAIAALAQGNLSQATAGSPLRQPEGVWNPPVEEPEQGGSFLDTARGYLEQAGRQAALVNPGSPLAVAYNQFYGEGEEQKASQDTSKMNEALARAFEQYNPARSLGFGEERKESEQERGTDLQSRLNTLASNAGASQEALIESLEKQGPPVPAQAQAQAVAARENVKRLQEQGAPADVMGWANMLAQAAEGAGGAQTVGQALAGAGAGFAQGYGQFEQAQRDFAEQLGRAQQQATAAAAQADAKEQELAREFDRQIAELGAAKAQAKNEAQRQALQARIDSATSQKDLLLQQKRLLELREMTSGPTAFSIGGDEEVNVEKLGRGFQDERGRQIADSIAAAVRDQDKANTIATRILKESNANLSDVTGNNALEKLAMKRYGDPTKIGEARRDVFDYLAKKVNSGTKEGKALGAQLLAEKGYLNLKGANNGGG
jgi:hypothetical protein